MDPYGFSNLFDQVTSDAQAWFVPSIAGLFALVGAFIALLSTRASDGRKQRADDRRQWDRDIRESYSKTLEASQLFSSIKLTKVSDKEGMRKLADEMIKSLTDMRRSNAIIAPITTEGHRQALDELLNKCWAVFGKVRDYEGFGDAKAVRDAQAKLFSETRKALRLPSDRRKRRWYFLWLR